MKKTFDAVSWMRKRREQIDREDALLTWEEKKQKTHSAISDDPIWQRLKSRVVSESQKQGKTCISAKELINR